MRFIFLFEGLKRNEDGWIDPSGNMFPVEMHEDWAAAHFKRQAEDGDLTKYSTELIRMGWLRLVWEAPVVWVNGDGVSPAQRRALEELGATFDATVLFGSSRGAKTIYAPPDRV